MKSIFIFVVLLSFSYLSVDAQIKADQLKSEAVLKIAKCLHQYSNFQETGNPVDLIRGTKYASQATVFILFLTKQFPKSLKEENVNNALKSLDGLSKNIPERFIVDPSSVTQDVGFVTFLHLIKMEMADIFGPLPEVTDEE